MFAISNDELEGLKHAGTNAPCPECKKKHKISYGTDAKTGEVSKILGYVKCSSGKLYLVAVNGKLIH